MDCWGRLPAPLRATRVCPERPSLGAAGLRGLPKPGLGPRAGAGWVCEAATEVAGCCEGLAPAGAALQGSGRFPGVWGSAGAGSLWSQAGCVCRTGFYCVKNKQGDGCLVQLNKNLVFNLSS